MNGCESCTLCCKYMRVDELEKSEHVWCKHCNIGNGCEIYDGRPESCRVYECVWLKTQSTENPMPLEFRPDNSRVVIGTANKGDDIVFYVSQDRPDAWNHIRFKKFTAGLKKRGVPVFVRLGEKMKKI